MQGGALWDGCVRLCAHLGAAEEPPGEAEVDHVADLVLLLASGSGGSRAARVAARGLSLFLPHCDDTSSVSTSYLIFGAYGSAIGKLPTHGRATPEGVATCFICKSLPTRVAGRGVYNSLGQ